MPAPADTYESLAFDYGLAMFLASATWLLVTDNEPRARTIYFTGGDIEVTGEENQYNMDDELIALDPPYALASQLEVPKERIAVGMYKRSGQINIRVTIAPPAEMLPAAAMKWAKKIFTAIANEIQAQEGAVGKLAICTAKATLSPIPDSSGALAGYFTATITIDWSN